MKSLKKMIAQYLRVITLVMVLIIIAIAITVECLNEQRHARENAERMIGQVEQLLTENQNDLKEVVETYAQTCLSNAEAIAYLIQQSPEVLESISELRKIADLMQVDEIHIFDTTGRIFTGTHPEYFDYTFETGEQIGFFKPLLEDKSLRLCQEITPNTAEGKLMQYSALWSENGEFIVQIGMEPINVMKITKKNELSYVFSLLRVNVGASFYAIDKNSGLIVGSTSKETLDKPLTQIGFSLDKIKKNGNGFHATINGSDSYCIFKEVESNYIGYVISNDTLYQRLPANVLELVFCLVLVALILVGAVRWYINVYVVDVIQNTNHKLKAITAGNLEEHMDSQNSTEFTELSTHINDMVKHLSDNNKKISYVLSKTNMYIGVYEYNPHMKQVRFTEYVPQILGLEWEEVKNLAADPDAFKAYIQSIFDHPLPDDKDIYRLGKDRERYVRLEEMEEKEEIFGVIMDVTDEVLRRRKIEAERDIDALTGLYNRRGLENMLSILFSQPQNLGLGAMIMLDADGLKEINDHLGHERGDIYLQRIAGILQRIGTKSSVAGRLGGDEYVLFLYGYDSEDELTCVLQLLEYVQNNSTVYLGDNIKVDLRFSFGVCPLGHETDYQKLMKEADDKMYTSKRIRKAEYTATQKAKKETSTET